MMRPFAIVLAACSALFAQTESSPAGKMIVTVGAPGTVEYGLEFSTAAAYWKEAAEAAQLDYVEIGQVGDKNDRDKLHAEISEALSDTATPLWLVFIGHGTSDGKTAKFNLRGRDVASTELGEWLRKCQRPLVIVNAFSCSGAFLKDLRGASRVVITATSSGAELNYSRFSTFFAESIGDETADLDHDNQVSLLEAYLLASSKVARFYESESRLATEHSLLEDNDDGKGTPADFFVGIRAEAKSKSGASTDGRLAHRYILIPSDNVPQLNPEQIKQRDRIEAEVELLRNKKSSLSEDAYYKELERLFVELASVYQHGSR